MFYEAKELSLGILTSGNIKNRMWAGRVARIQSAERYPSSDTGMTDNRIFRNGCL
ncbi:hypothetical protein JCM10003_1124 [Bacteroides pyogenes JCM 10003]|nr:hypothetical protein JCM10003_1124 [Bacteroides pyogenes JCM 10003]